MKLTYKQKCCGSNSQVHGASFCLELACIVPRCKALRYSHCCHHTPPGSDPQCCLGGSKCGVNAGNPLISPVLYSSVTLPGDWEKGEMRAGAVRK